MKSPIQLDLEVNSWTWVTCCLIFFAINAQIAAQLGVFTRGINSYTAIQTLDVYLHILWNAMIFSVVLEFVKFRTKWDLWILWFPFQILIATVYEFIELIITWFVLLPPEVMVAALENSLLDIVIAVLTLFTINFIYERWEEWYNSKQYDDVPTFISKKKQGYSDEEIEELLR